MLKIKPGVRILGLKPELLLGIMIVERGYAIHGIKCVITSIVDGKHSRGSIHYAGYACDFRTRNIPAHMVDLVYKKLKEALGADFDFIYEQDHFHLEYQPKLSY